MALGHIACCRVWTVHVLCQFPSMLNRQMAAFKHFATRMKRKCRRRKSASAGVRLRSRHASHHCTVACGARAHYPWTASRRCIRTVNLNSTGCLLPSFVPIYGGQVLDQCELVPCRNAFQFGIQPPGSTTSGRISALPNLQAPVSKQQGTESGAYPTAKIYCRPSRGESPAFTADPTRPDTFGLAFRRPCPRWVATKAVWPRTRRSPSVPTRILIAPAYVPAP